MATINPNSPSPTGQPTGADAQPLEADDAAVEHFEKALQNQPTPAKSSGFFDGFVVDTTKTNSFFDDFKVIPKPVEPTKKDDIIDLDNFEPEKPEPPKPEAKKSDFWDNLWSGVKKGADSVKEFLAKPEVAQFVRAANIVFAGAMVVTAGVMIATGVGAPAGIAALALAGGAGLTMQLPAVHDKLQSGVVAMVAPVIGQVNAEKLGPLVTQGLISGLMIAIVATGGQAGSAQGALDATVGVFNSMKDVFNGMAQVYQAGGPLLENLGVNVDAKALQEMAGMFGVMVSLMPDLSKFAEGLGGSLKDFLANPDMDTFKKSLGTLKDVPESLAKLIDSDFLKGLGSLLEGGEKFLTEVNSSDFLKNITGLLQLLSQGANLAKA
jgi:hypothetical protein